MIGRALGTLAGKMIAGAVVVVALAGAAWWVVDLIGDRRELQLVNQRLAENVAALERQREADQREILHVTDEMRRHREEAEVARDALDALRDQLATVGGDRALSDRLHRFRLRLGELTRSGPPQADTPANP